MSQDFWHELRSKHVGGSEIAAVLGVSPYLSRFKLWHIKKGLIEPDDLSNNDRVKAGNYLEAGILSWASEHWGVPLSQPHVYAKHPTVAGMGCTPDAFSPERPEIMAQVKNVDSLEFAKNWRAHGDIILDAPLHILLQCQHELGCLPDRAENWLIACVGGNRLARMVIPRRDETIRIIEESVKEFWESIDLDAPPPVDYEADYETVTWLHRHSTDGKTVDMTSNNRLAAVLGEYKVASAGERDAKKAKDTARAEILEICGDAQHVVCGEMAVTLVEVKGTPKKIIDASMVGQEIGGLEGYRYPRIGTLKEK